MGLILAHSIDESLEYGKHWGLTKASYLALGEGLSAPEKVTGTIRTLYDTVTLTENLVPDTCIYCWEFKEDCILIDGSLEIEVPIGGSSPCQMAIARGDEFSVEYIYSLWDSTATTVVSTNRGLKDNKPLLNILRGDILIFMAYGGGAVLFTGLKMNYSLSYSSNL